MLNYNVVNYQVLQELRNAQRMQQTSALIDEYMAN